MTCKENLPSKGSRGEYLVVLQFLLLAAFIVIPVWPDLGETAFFGDSSLVRWPVLALFWATALALGGFGSHRIREFLTPLPYPVDHNRLVTTGIYGLVRHPLYSSQLFAAFGWAVFALSLSHLFLFIIAFLFFNYKASKEEAWLTLRHPEYREYAMKVKKFIPWLY